MSSIADFDPETIDHEHPDINGGWLRPAVFGAMDGLVSNFALIMGVAGGTMASGSTKPVILAGIAGLAAGAFSMAAGEYTSVASQSELALEQVDVERREIIKNDQAEQTELVALLQEHGISTETAKQASAEVHRDLEKSIKFHALLEMGIDTDDLASPKLAALSSFVSFTVGAMVPLLPYVLGVASPLVSIVVSLLGLFLCGAIVTKVTNVPWWFGGIRQLALGAAAAGVTFMIGSWVGG